MILRVIINKNVAMFLGAVLFFLLVFIFKQNLGSKQTYLLSEIEGVTNEISTAHERFSDIKKNSKNILSIFDNKKTKKYQLGELLKEIARTKHFNQLQFTFMPEKLVYQDNTLIIKKSIVNLLFSTYLDCDIWDFFHDFFEKFPGIIHSKNLLIEKEKNDEIIKGLYRFEWYNVQSISKK